MRRKERDAEEDEAQSVEGPRKREAPSVEAVQQRVEEFRATDDYAPDPNVAPLNVGFFELERKRTYAASAGQKQVRGEG